MTLTINTRRRDLMKALPAAGITLGLRVGAPGHRLRPGWRMGAPCPFPFAAFHAA